MASELGKRIREARERAHLTQEQLAVQVGVTFRSVGNWERGQSVPRNRLAALEKILGVDLGSGEPRTSVDDVSPPVHGDVMLDLPPAIFEGMSANQIDELKANIRAEAWKRRREIMGE